MKVNSSVITQLPMGITGGGEIDVPEIILGTFNPRMPMLAVASNASIDLRRVEASTFASQSINQGPSTGAGGSVTLATFDKGLYHIVGGCFSNVFGGLLPSSAAPFSTQLDLLTPNGAAAGVIARVPFDGATPFFIPFDVTVFFTQSGWSLRLTPFISTGVGQSIAHSAWSTISRLL